MTLSLNLSLKKSGFIISICSPHSRILLSSSLLGISFNLTRKSSPSFSTLLACDGKGFDSIYGYIVLSIFNKIRRHFKIPVTTDIHNIHDADFAAKYVDILQIPAFLVRQTDLLVAAAKTKKVVNLKKGQFMSPESM